MSKAIIEVKGISKRYQLGAIGATRLRDDVERFWHRVTGKADKTDEKEFWALRDVSFEVQPGEIVGIIGRNGAGKSTLLKILSRITDPTNGEIVMRGRVASLLEVGTGFHADLSGRENIFLNGAILGMSKAEIRGKLDEIIAFAEIEKFIDTPVKRYSSGMYVRLAFAVAAHLEPEILIVDEVLAVGDAAFQKKCLGKMQDVAGHGRTILFVSHNMGAILTLCNKAVWLADGKRFMAGTANEVGNAYLNANTVQSQRRIELDAVSRNGPFGVRARIVAVEWLGGVPLRHGSPVRVRFEIVFSSATEDVMLGIGFSTMDGVRVATYNSETNHKAGIFLVDASGKRSFELYIDELPLNPGLYSIDLGCKSGDDHALDYLKGAGSVEVVPGPNTPASYFGKESSVRLDGLWKSTSTNNHKMLMPYDV